MAEIIVACAGCGKRYKGASGTKKFKCAACQNLFTYPDSPRTPPAGKLLCSFCWTEVEAREDLQTCPSCSQKISPHCGGRAAIASSSASLQRTVILPELSPEHAAQSGDAEAKLTELQTEIAAQQQARQESEANGAALQAELAAVRQARQELEVKVSELLNMLTNAQTTQATMRMERDRAVAALDDARTQTAKVQAEMDHFRQMAVAALEPINSEYKEAMKTLIVDAQSLVIKTQEVQEATRERVEHLKVTGERLEQRIRDVRRKFAERLSAVLGTDAQLTPAPVPREGLNLETAPQAASTPTQ